MKTTHSPPISVNESSWQCFKPTLMFLSIASLICASYFYQFTDNLVLKFETLQEREYWRLITSPIASSSSLQLFANLVACITLTIVSERIKGTVLYSFELFFKIFTINAISVLLYFVMVSLADIYEGIFTFFLTVQNQNPSEGLQYVLVAELFQILSNPTFNESVDQSKKFSNAAMTFMGLYSIILFGLNFEHLGFTSAIIVGFMSRICSQRYANTLQHSRIIHIFESLLSPVSCLVYLSDKPSYEINYFESCELSSIQSNRDNNVKAVNVSNIMQDLSLQSTSKTEENSKSRYEEVNIQEFILNAQNKAANLKHDESFEI